MTIYTGKPGSAPHSLAFHFFHISILQFFHMAVPMQDALPV